jgi:hypothetical protein
MGLLPKWFVVVVREPIPPLHLHSSLNPKTGKLQRHFLTTFQTRGKKSFQPPVAQPVAAAGCNHITPFKSGRVENFFYSQCVALSFYHDKD